MKKTNKKNITFLHPGKAVITNKSRVVYTVLGSCIAIVMYVKRLKIGAIAHCLMPEPSKIEDCDCSSCPYKFKYISCSIPLMLESLQKYDVTPNEIEVKIFGGSNIILSKNGDKVANSIGQQNIDLATKIIEETNLNVISFDTGGSMGRKLYFYTENGEVHLKRIKKSEMEKENHQRSCNEKNKSINS